MDINIKTVRETNGELRMEFKCAIRSCEDAAKLIDLVKVNAEAAFDGVITLGGADEED